MAFSISRTPYASILLYVPDIFLYQQPVSYTHLIWACRSEAVSVIYVQLNEIVKPIEECTESTSNSKVRAQGKGILI